MTRCRHWQRFNPMRQARPARFLIMRQGSLVRLRRKSLSRPDKRQDDRGCHRVCCRAMPRAASCFCRWTCFGNTAAARTIFLPMRASPELRAALAEFRLRARRHLKRIAELSADIPEKIWPAFVSLAPLRPWLSVMERTAYQAVSAARTAGLAGAVAHLAGGKIARTDRPLITRRQPPRRLPIQRSRSAQCTGGERAFACQSFRRRCGQACSCGRRSAPAPKAETDRNSRSSAGTTMGRHRWCLYDRR